MLTIQSKKVKAVYKQYYPLLRQLFNTVIRDYYPNATVELSLILTSAHEVHTLNREYRNIDRTTDVLTFAALEGEDFSQDEYIELGDIFINIDAVKNQAQAYGHSEKRELAFLFMHGLLHTLGYDHMNEADEKEMFALQDKYLDPVIQREKEI